MTCQVILEFRVKPEIAANVAVIQQWFREKLPDTRAYDGFVSLSVLRNQDDPAVFMISELWDSRKHYETYLQWRVESGAVAELGAMLVGEPSFRYFDIAGV